MKAAEAVKEIMKQQDVRVGTLSARLNIKSNVLSERLGQTNLSMAKLNEMLRALDYKVIAVPRDTRLQEGHIELE